jgi:hypothetical protein
LPILEVTRNSRIQSTMKLSENMTLANYTTGMPNGYKSFAPLMRSHLIDIRNPRINSLRNFGVRFLFQHHKIARNLQHTSDTIIEPLLSKYGRDLQLYTGYINPLEMGKIGDQKSKHFTGEAVNLFLRSSQNNMFMDAEEILDKVKGQFTSAFLIFNHGSWLHLANNGPFGFLRGTPNNPLIRSFDMVSGLSQNGLAPLRGMTKSPWEILEYAPFAKIRNNNPVKIDRRLGELFQGIAANTPEIIRNNIS